MSNKKQPSYFKMSEAMDEFSCSMGTQEKSVAGLKLVGKGLFNTVKFAAVEALPAFVQNVKKQSSK